MTTIKEKIENNTIPDASENIIVSSPNQKKNSLQGKENTTQAETEATTDATGCYDINDTSCRAYVKFLRHTLRSRNSPSKF